MFDLIYIIIIIYIYIHDLLNKEQIHNLCVNYKFWLIIFSQTMLRLETPVLRPYTQRNKRCSWGVKRNWKNMAPLLQ